MTEPADAKEDEALQEENQNWFNKLTQKQNKLLESQNHISTHEVNADLGIVPCNSAIVAA